MGSSKRLGRPAVPLSLDFLESEKLPECPMKNQKAQNLLAFVEGPLVVSNLRSVGDQAVNSACVQQVRAELGDVIDAQKSQCRLDLVSHDWCRIGRRRSKEGSELILDSRGGEGRKSRLTFDGMHNSLLSPSQSVKQRSTNRHTLGTQAQSLNRVSSASDAAVEVDLALLILDDLGVELVDF